MIPRTARHLLVVSGSFGHLTIPGGLSGQNDMVPVGAAAFAVLEGAWDGTRTLFDRPAPLPAPR
jgi:hypothetical protein